MSNTPQTSINAVQSALGFWVPTVGTNNEPALSAANMVQQIMTSPPFRFPWNRNSLTFTTFVGVQDYLVNVTDFGYMETATFTNITTNKVRSFSKILNNTPLGESSDSQEPVTLTVQSTVVGTSATFRFLGLPNNQYNVTVWYQKYAPLFVNLTTPWVLPDYMSYIYNRGLLAFLYEARSDLRAQQEKISFAAALLSTAEGLTDTEINVFLAQYLANPRMLESLQLKTQQGVSARGM